MGAIQQATISYGAAGASTLLNNLVAFWKLEEASGTRDDAVGANDLTDNNTVTQAAGKIGNAAQFTAANSEYLSIADNTDLSTGDIAFTFAGWVYLDTNNGYRTIITKRNGAGLNIEYILRYDGLNQNRFEFYVGNGAGSFDNIVANTFGAASTATWYFVAAWHNSGGTINISINNGTADSKTPSVHPADTAETFTMGANTDGSEAVDGRIDALGFWKRALTADERTELYNGGAGREHPFA